MEWTVGSEKEGGDKAGGVMKGQGLRARSAAADAQAGSGGRKGGTAGWSSGRCGVPGAHAQARLGCQALMRGATCRGRPAPPPRPALGTDPRTLPALRGHRVTWIILCHKPGGKKYFPLSSPPHFPRGEPPAPQQGAAHAGGRGPRLCFPGTCCGSQIATLLSGIRGPPASVRGWACLAAGSTVVGRPGEGVRGTAALPGRAGPRGAGVGAAPAGALTAALAPSLPPCSLLPPSLRGRGRVSAARRPGNAADAPRSIPGGGSAPVLPYRRRCRGPARSRRPAQGQGGGRVGRRGSRRRPPPARPRPAPGSSAWRGAAGRRPRARRDLPLLKPERVSGCPGAGPPAPTLRQGAWAFPLPAPAPAAPSAGSTARRHALPSLLLLPLLQFPRLRLADYDPVSGFRRGEGNWPVIA